MALDLGTLTGYLEMDDSKAESVLSMLPSKITGSGVVMGAAAAGVAALVGSSLAEGVGTAMDLQDARAKLTAELGLTGPESERLGGIAGKLYAQAYGGSIDEVNDAVSDVVSSIDGMRGASNEAVSDMTAKVLNFNSTFGVETARTTQLVGQMLKTGLAGDANEAMDLLTSAMQRVPKAVREDVLDATDEYGPFFAQLGLSGSQAMQALVDGSKQGMYGIDKTGDALKELTIRATDMSKTSEASYKAAGLNAEDMAARFLKGGDTAKGALSDLVTGLQGIKDPTDQANAAIGLFGTPLEDLGVGKIPAFLDSLGNMGDGMEGVKGSSDKMGKAINDTASVGLTQFNRSWDMAVGTLVSGVIPVLTQVMNFLNSNPAVLKAVAAAVGVLGIAFVALTVATWAMNSALLVNPITWIVVGIVAAVALLIAAVVAIVRNWDSIVGWITGVFGAVWGWLQGVIDGFVGWWNGLWGGFASGATDAWAGLMSFLDGVGAWWSGLWGGFAGMLADGWNAVIAFLVALPGQFVAWLASLGTAILAGLVALPGLLYDGLTTGIAYGLAALYAFFVLLPAQIASWLTSAGTWLLQTGISLLLGMATGIANGWAAVSAWFAALPGRVVAFVVSFATLLVVWGLNLLRGLQNGINNGWTAVVGFFSALPGRIINFVVSFSSLLVSRGLALLRGLASGITSGAAAVWSFMSGLPGRIVGYVSSFASLLVSRGTALLRGLANGISSGASAVWSFLTGLPGQITSRLGSLGSTLLSAGGDLMRGLLSGIRGGLGNILGAIGSMAGDIMGKFKSILGIASPSKVFRSYGQFIGQGLVLGMMDLQSDIDSQVGGMVGSPTLTVGVGNSGIAAGDGTGVGTAGGVNVSTVVHGNVGWDADEVTKRQAENTNRAMALAGLRGPIGVS